MDGNGRWAAARGLPVEAGHREGTRALRRTVEAAIDLGDLDARRLRLLDRELVAPAGRGRGADGDPRRDDRPGASRPRAAGRADTLPRAARPRPRRPARADGRRSSASTADLDTLALWIAFDYGGRAELVEAARRCVEDGLAADEIDEAAIAARLYAPELPEIDLLIRTSGEFRISNFMLWETAYAEFVFTDTLWPDFGADDLRAALDAFASRDRRFGGR